MTTEDRFRIDPAAKRPVTAVRAVRDTLRAAILRGDLPGGSRLVQTEIASRLGVSTTPVREAMRDLAAEGLIEMDSHRIGTVRTPDSDEIVEIVEIRHTLERLAIERAMKGITAEDLEAARRLADLLAAEDDPGTWMHLNIQFHRIFHVATRTKRLGAILSALEEAGGVFVVHAQMLDPGIRRRAVHDHYALLDAFERNDVEEAHEIQLRHVNLSLEAADRA